MGRLSARDEQSSHGLGLRDGGGGAELTPLAGGCCGRERAPLNGTFEERVEGAERLKRSQKCKL